MHLINKMCYQVKPIATDLRFFQIGLLEDLRVRFFTIIH